MPNRAARLAERLASQGRATGRVPRVVFASSIAVYGLPGPRLVSEDQAPCPATSYGAHKLVTEVLLADLSRRGEIDARSLPVPLNLGRHCLAMKVPLGSWPNIRLRTTARSGTSRPRYRSEESRTCPR